MYSTLPVCTCLYLYMFPVCTCSFYMYIYGVCSVHVVSHCNKGRGLGLPQSLFIRFDRFFLHGPPGLPDLLLTRIHASIQPDPCPRSTLFPAWAGAPPINPCYHPPIPWPETMGSDPRVCVHPTLLPPINFADHICLIWLSSTSSVVNLK
jgi:hypothetical protein